MLDRAFRRQVDQLIPLYAIGVFTSFTLSQAGMAKRHLRLQEPDGRAVCSINGSARSPPAWSTIVFAVTKFAHGAWVVMLAVPILVAILVRLNRTYEAEDEQLVIGPEDRANGVASRAEAPPRSCW